MLLSGLEEYFHRLQTQIPGSGLDTGDIFSIMLLDTDLSERLSIAPVGDLGSHLVKCTYVTQRGGRWEIIKVYLGNEGLWSVPGNISLNSKENFSVEAHYFDAPGTAWEGTLLSPYHSMNNMGKIELLLLHISLIVALVKGLIFYCIFNSSNRFTVWSMQFRPALADEGWYFSWSLC